MNMWKTKFKTKYCYKHLKNIKILKYKYKNAWKDSVWEKITKCGCKKSEKTKK